MPYITKFDREKYEKPLAEIEKLLSDLSNDKVAGEINFVFTRLCKAALCKFHRYARYNAVVGALECAKLELYRTEIAPYENVKRAENGDV